MPYKSDAQRKYFNANRAELEAQGVDVDEWNESSRGKKLPPKAKKKNPEKSAVALLAKLAADPISAKLQGLLSNCLDLSLLLKHCHWNVRGTMFSPVHKFLDKVYELTVEISDDIAERMVALDYPASGISSDVVAKSSMGDMATKFIGPETIINELTTKLTKLVDMFKSGITETDSDPVTSNMLQDMTHKLEKSLWMLRSQKPNTATKEAFIAKDFTNMFSDYLQPTNIKTLAKLAAGRCTKEAGLLDKGLGGAFLGAGIPAAYGLVQHMLKTPNLKHLTKQMRSFKPNWGNIATGAGIGGVGGSIFGLAEEREKQMREERQIQLFNNLIQQLDSTI